MAAAGTTRSEGPPEPPAGGREVRPGVVVFPDAAALARAAAGHFAALAAEFAERAGAFRVALAGGATPLPVYRLLAAEPYRSGVPWERVHVFFSDERRVGPSHPASNFGASRRELLARVPLPLRQVHRMEGEREPPGLAAQAYERVLADQLPRAGGGLPQLDLVLLGMGADGHTASLFPGPHTNAVTSRWVVTPWVEPLAQRRMTLTLPVINAAHHVLFLITGKEKAQALAGVIAGDPELPATLVQPRSGRVRIFADAAAARLLSGGGA